jgi:hypothetical protein
MSCDQILAVHRRIRVARASATGGWCTVARKLMASAALDLADIEADGATNANACARALAHGTSKFLAEGRRLLRAQCPTGGSR